VEGRKLGDIVDVDERSITHMFPSKLSQSGGKREVDPCLCAFSSSCGKAGNLIIKTVVISIPEDLCDDLHERLVPLGADELQASLLKEKAARAALGWDTLHGVVLVVEEGPPTLTRRL